MNIRRISMSIVLISFLVPGLASASHSKWYNKSPLVKMVREATAKFKDVQIAESMGYVAGPCVSGPNKGAMGIHYVNPGLLDDAAPVLDQPEALIYEPLPGGKLRLVGIEYITFAGPAVLAGHLFQFDGSPSRTGLPDIYQLHVWAWKKNPSGTFANWNPRVSCDATPAM